MPAFRLRALAPFAGRLALAGLVAVAVLLGLATLVQERAMAAGFVPLAAYLAAAAVLGGGGFYLVTWVLGVAEARALARRARALFRARS